jgi:TolB-like protein/DNA-binding winged helix-turn-helix (wHTH) protein/cytochrome c-type biogenesis protein CcmH/NrfG
MLTTPRRLLSFDQFTLDLERCSLRRGGEDLRLRPKAFDVLRYLAEHPGRLITKDELIEGLWPGIHVTDDSLVQCIGDIRQSLGDDAHSIIKTVPRRGYLFAAQISQMAENAPAALTAGATVYAGAPARRIPSVGWRSLILLAAGLIAIGAAGRWAFRETLRTPSIASMPAIDHTDRTKTAVAQSKPSIAVLPLLNLNADARQDYFSDGVTEDIINALSRFSSLTVMSANAVFPYKGKTARPEDIGRNLAIRYLVEGNVLRIGERVRVNVRLTDAERGSVLWAGRFDEALQDLFALRDKITSQIVVTLAIKVTELERERSMAKPTASLEAYDYVLRARPALRHPVRATNVEARALFGRAIELDPGYAAAYLGLSETLVSAVSMGWMEAPTQALERAEALAVKSLNLNSAEARAHVLLARIHVYFRRYDRAQAELQRAVAMNPNDAEVLAGHGSILLWEGQTDAAIEALEAARNINPDLNHADRFALGLAYYLRERHDAGIELLESNLSESPTDNYNHVLLAMIYALQDRREDAARELAAVRRLLPLFDPDTFGSQLQNPADRNRVRDGLRKLEDLL